MKVQVFLSVCLAIEFLQCFWCIEEKNWDLLYLLKKEANISFTNEFTIMLKSTTDYSKMFLSAKTLFPSNVLPTKFVIILKIKFLNRIKSPGTIFSITDPNSGQRLSLTVNTSPGIVDKVTLNIIFHPVDEERIDREIFLPFTKQTIWTLGLSIIDDKIVFYTSCEDIKRPFGYQFIAIRPKLDRTFFRDGAIISIFNDRDGLRKLRGEVFELSFANYEGKLQFLCSKSMIDGSGSKKSIKGQEKFGNILLFPEKVIQPDIDDDLDKVFSEEIATLKVIKSTSNYVIVTKSENSESQSAQNSTTKKGTSKTMSSGKDNLLGTDQSKVVTATSVHVKATFPPEDEKPLLTLPSTHRIGKNSPRSSQSLDHTKIDDSSPRITSHVTNSITNTTKAPHLWMLNVSNGSSSPNQSKHLFSTTSSKPTNNNSTEFRNSTGNSKAEMTESRSMEKVSVLSQENEVTKSINPDKISSTNIPNENDWTSVMGENKLRSTQTEEIDIGITPKTLSKEVDIPTRLVIGGKRGEPTVDSSNENTNTKIINKFQCRTNNPNTITDTMIYTDEITSMKVTSDISVFKDASTSKSMEKGQFKDKTDVDQFLETDDVMGPNTYSKLQSKETTTKHKQLSAVISRSSEMVTGTWYTTKSIYDDKLHLPTYGVTTGTDAQKKITTAISNEDGRTTVEEITTGITSETISGKLETTTTLVSAAEKSETTESLVKEQIISKGIKEQYRPINSKAMARTTEVTATDVIKNRTMSHEADTKSLNSGYSEDKENVSNYNSTNTYSREVNTSEYYKDIDSHNNSTSSKITDYKKHGAEDRSSSTESYPVVTGIPINTTRQRILNKQTTVKDILAIDGENQCQLYINQLDKLKNCKGFGDLNGLMTTQFGIGTKGEKGLPGEKGNIGPRGNQGICEISRCQSGNYKYSEKGDKGNTGECNVNSCPTTHGEKGEQGSLGLQGNKGDRGDPAFNNVSEIKYVLARILAAEKEYILKNMKGNKGDSCSKKCDIQRSENRGRAQGTDFKAKKNEGHGTLIFDSRESLEKVAFNLPMGSMVLLLKSDLLLIKVDHQNNIWRSLSLESRSKDWILPGPRPAPKIEPRVDPYQKRQTKILYLVALPMPTTGDLKSTIYQPGGYNGAMFQCQQNGDIYGYGRSMQPLINTDTNNIKYIIGRDNLNYPIYNSRGERLANDYQSFLSSTDDIQSEILDFDRKPIRDNIMTSCVWIGNERVSQSREKRLNNQNRCNNWMTRDSRSEGLVSILLPFKSIMSEDSVNRRSCSLHCHILCIQTQLHIQ